MSISSAVFVGIQAVSLLMMAVLLLEFQRLRRQRSALIAAMSGKKPKQRANVVGAVYVVTTLCILVFTSVLFFR